MQTAMRTHSAAKPWTSVPGEVVVLITDSGTVKNVIKNYGLQAKKQTELTRLPARSDETPARHGDRSAWERTLHWLLAAVDIARRHCTNPSAVRCAARQGTDMAGQNEQVLLKRHTTIDIPECAHIL
ncbi:hypothetical protein DSCA_08540 [Desulfosarcina alkanivorans]|uniref:Uncharacterized protein n=1 Tax=Desulfosarcina alkanivorans TaxID=571177 RepID=A0A5K7YKV1_9BACT|nr:hypothetical protein DSCA_08540 [Desulfosarcina alkanivorans]